MYRKIYHATLRDRLYYDDLPLMPRSRTVGESSGTAS
jgi:hypothetical protein